MKALSKKNAFAFLATLSFLISENGNCSQGKALYNEKFIRTFFSVVNREFGTESFKLLGISNSVKRKSEGHRIVAELTEFEEMGKQLEEPKKHPISCQIVKMYVGPKKYVLSGDCWLYSDYVYYGYITQKMVDQIRSENPDYGALKDVVGSDLAFPCLFKGHENECAEENRELSRGL